VGGETLDLSAVLIGYGAGIDDATDFVQFVGSGNDTKVQVDADGAANGVVFVDVALLQNVTLTNVNQAILEGNLDLN
jgi:hypothetical protein